MKIFKIFFNLMKWLYVQKAHFNFKNKVVVDRLSITVPLEAQLISINIFYRMHDPDFGDLG